jgi:cell filamentation protein
MYKAERNPYCYPGTSVLINLLDLRDQAALDAFEADASAERSSQPLPGGRLGYRHYLAVHQHLFGDVYAWAGQIRKVRIAKQGHAFCYPEHIDREMRRLFADLETRKQLSGKDAATFATQAAHFLAELNAIHPFREGNGRTQLSFFMVLAERAGHPLAFGRCEPQAMLAAMIKSFDGDEKPLTILIERLIS